MNIESLHKNCYIPYSNKTAVAVVESEKGTFYPGVRIENLAFPLTISAVQNAIYCCLSEGEKPQKLYTDTESDPLNLFWINEFDLTVESIKQLSPKIEFAEILIADVKIRNTLQKLLPKALVQNSQFPVSCLIETDKGFISGVNIENHEWTSGLCAERVAIGKAFSYGITDFKAIYITTQKGEYCSPCGACRQVLTEHLYAKKAHLYHPDGTKSVHFCSDLLPYSFQSSSLKNIR